MSRTLHLLLFLGIASLVFGGGHYYIFVRLTHYFALSGLMRKYLAIALGGLFIVLVATLPLSRLLPLQTATPLTWFSFTWMGTAMILGLSLLACDIATGVMPIFIFNQGDPERRLFLQRAFGFAALGSAAALSAGALWNGLRPVEVKSFSVKLAKLPMAREGFKIVQITDLHIGPTLDGKWLRDVVDKVNALNADVIALTGDLVDGSVADLGPQVESLRDLRAKHGVLFVTGNHEYYSGVDTWIAHLKMLGIRVLRNERVTLFDDNNSNPIDFAGVDDFASGQFHGHGPDLLKALKDRDTARPVILLAHQPAAIREAAANGVDFQLSGHTHGGQIWPWNYFVYIQQPYVSGLHRYPNSDSQIYVSDGTGFWGPPMRLGTAAEITKITLSGIKPA
jgi:predicted MPP superfamily phosphohydrolase